jgi:hypothetical protein
MNFPPDSVYRYIQASLTKTGEIKNVLEMFNEACESVPSRAVKLPSSTSI